MANLCCTSASSGRGTQPYLPGTCRALHSLSRLAEVVAVVSPSTRHIRRATTRAPLPQTWDAHVRRHETKPLSRSDVRSVTGVNCQAVGSLADYLSGPWPRGLAGLVINLPDGCLAVCRDLLRTLGPFVSPQISLPTHRKSLDKLLCSKWVRKEAQGEPSVAVIFAAAVAAAVTSNCVTVS